MRRGAFQEWRRRRRRKYKHQPGVVPWLLSLPTRLGLVVFRALPSSFSLWLAERVGRLMWLLPSRRRIADANIARALPELDAKERARIGRKSCGHFARNLAETIAIGADLKPEDLEGLGTYDPDTRELLRSPRGTGAVFVQGHFGSMEGLDGLLGSYGLRLLTVVRLPYNYYVAEALTKGREGWGVDLIRRDGALKKLRTRLQEGGSVMLPMDVNAARGGIFVEWFGELASTEPAAAWLAIRTGRPLIVCWAVRGERRHTWRAGAKLVRPESPPEKPTDEALHELTRQIHEVLEKAIRAFPEQYLWVHNRYRTRPRGEAKT